MRSAGLTYRADLRNRHLEHYDLLMAPNRDRSLFLITLLFSKEKIPVKVVIDTGSSLLWIFESSCINSQREQVCGAKIDDISYGYLDGGIRGILISTDVYINEGTVNEDCSIMLTQYANSSVDEPILGLGPKTHEFPTFLEKLKINDLIDRLVFSIDISNSKILFGRDDGFNHLSMIPLSSSTSYQVDIQRITFLGHQLTNITIDGIIDSGNTLIAIPFHLKSKFMSILRQQGLECSLEIEDNIDFSNVFCSLVFKRFNGSLDFWMSGKRYSISQNDFVDECEDGFGFRKCKTAIEFHQSSYGIILGQPFLKKYRATFDLESREVGFEPSSSKVLDY